MTKRQDLKEVDCVTVAKGATGDLAKMWILTQLVWVEPETAFLPGPLGMPISPDLGPKGTSQGKAPRPVPGLFLELREAKEAGAGRNHAGPQSVNFSVSLKGSQ